MQPNHSIKRLSLGWAFVAVGGAFASALLTCVIAHFIWDGGHPESMIGIVYIAVMVFGLPIMMLVWSALCIGLQHWSAPRLAKAVASLSFVGASAWLSIALIPIVGG